MTNDITHLLHHRRQLEFIVPALPMQDINNKTWSQVNEHLYGG